MVCGTIFCSGLGGPSGCVPSAHRKAPKKWRKKKCGRLGLDPVFHISLLCRYKPGGYGVEPPPPIVADEEEEYEVEALFSHQV